MASSFVNETDLTAACLSARPVHYCRWKTALQTALLISFSFLVAGLLWLRDTRSAAFTGEEDTVWENVCGEIPMPLITRDDVIIDGMDPSDDFWNPKAITTPEELQRLLPTGTTHEVTVVGGLSARMKDLDYGKQRKVNLVFAYEIRYRRTIEDNADGRIVELREYGPVRMVKILSPVDGMQLADKPELLRGIDSLHSVGPGEGVAIASAAEVAAAILGKGAEQVAAEPTSRAFVQEDSLSQRTVRLTFDGDATVTSIEPVGWTISKPLAMFLFNQPALLAPLLHQPKGEPEVGGQLIPTNGLTSFLPPPFAPFGPRRFLAVHEETAASGAHGYRMILVEGEIDTDWRGPRHRNDFPPRSAHRMVAVPEGKLICDPSNTCIAEATVAWPLADLDCSSYRLLFECSSKFQEPAIVYCHYRCEVL